ncbi:MAG: hypothetical protein V5B39_21775, partial [Accumulibacter sp.]|uniref:hypothetical protein n=1 Tax=Accumulibacter sp. TaxID=2053492 RepID=UPI002FC2CE74
RIPISSSSNGRYWPPHGKATHRRRPVLWENDAQPIMSLAEHLLVQQINRHRTGVDYFFRCD